MGRAKGGRRLFSPSLSLLRTSSQRRVSHPRSPTHAPTHPASFIDTKASHRAIGSTHLPSHSQTRHSSSVRTQSYNTESEDGSIRRLTINRTDTYTYLFRRVISHSAHANFWLAEALVDSREMPADMATRRSQIAREMATQK